MHQDANRVNAGQSLPKLLALLLAVGCTSVATAQTPAKAKTYPFTAAPLAIYDHLDMMKMGSVSKISEGERQILTKIWEMRSKEPDKKLTVDEAQLLEVFLFASGIEDEKQLDKLRLQYNALAKKAVVTVKPGRDDLQRGELLMKLLHTGFMKKGYDESQSSFAGVFETGKFNCVSATAMYYMLGTHVGFKLKPIAIPGLSDSVPGHATLDMQVGDRTVEVEATNADGFDWQTKIHRPGVTTDGLIPDRKTGYEIDGLGIAATIYMNRCVDSAHAKPPESLEALRYGVSALALAPADDSAAKDFIATLANWGPTLAEEKKFEEALRVTDFGARVAPKHEGIVNNRHFVWERYILALIEAGKDAEAVAVVARAHQAMPDDADYADASEWFVRWGSKLAKDKGPAEALPVVARGLKVLPEKGAKKLLEWRGGLFAGLSGELLKKQDVDQSFKLLAQAFAQDANDKTIQDAIAFHAQEALPILELKSPAAAVEHFRALNKQFPKVTGLGEAAVSFVGRKIDTLAKQQKFGDATVVLEQYSELVPSTTQLAEIGGSVYDSWAQQLVAKKDWKTALEKYEAGLKLYPKQEQLTNNAIVTIDQWAQTAIDAKNWDEAIGIYNLGLKLLPGEAHLISNRAVCVRNKAGK